MNTRVLDESDGRRVLLAVGEIGDEVVAELEALANTHELSAAELRGIGAFQDAVLAYWNWDTKEYEQLPVREQVEVLSLLGSITRAPDGGPQVHAHVVVGLRDGRTLGGHLLQARVRPTLEVFITESPAAVRRQRDETTGLTLID